MSSLSALDVAVKSFAFVLLRLHCIWESDANWCINKTYKLEYRYTFWDEQALAIEPDLLLVSERLVVCCVLINSQQDY